MICPLGYLIKQFLARLLICTVKNLEPVLPGKRVKTINRQLQTEQSDLALHHFQEEQSDLGRYCLQMYIRYFDTSVEDQSAQSLG